MLMAFNPYLDNCKQPIKYVGKGLKREIKVGSQKGKLKGKAKEEASKIEGCPKLTRGGDQTKRP